LSTNCAHAFLLSPEAAGFANEVVLSTNVVPLRKENIVETQVREALRF
jgi:hypothetical protein